MTADVLGWRFQGGKTPQGYKQETGKNLLIRNLRVGNMGWHVPRLGDSLLQGECGGFDSHLVHKTNSVVEESGLSRLLWEQKYAGSNPVYATNYTNYSF